MPFFYTAASLHSDFFALLRSVPSVRRKMLAVWECDASEIFRELSWFVKFICRTECYDEIEAGFVRGKCKIRCIFRIMMCKADKSLYGFDEHHRPGHFGFFAQDCDNLGQRVSSLLSSRQVWFR